MFKALDGRNAGFCNLAVPFLAYCSRRNIDVMNLILKELK